MTVALWASSVEANISQGDVFQFVLMGTLGPFVEKRTFPGNAHAWVETQSWKADQNGFGYALGRGRMFNAIVVSHSCDLDKQMQMRKRRVLVAPMSPGASLEEKIREEVFTTGEGHYNLVPLPDVPSLGDYYADLRGIAAIPRESLDENARKASMSPIGLRELQLRLVRFFVRDDLTPYDPGR